MLDPITREAAENYLTHHSDSIKLSEETCYGLLPFPKSITKFHQYILENGAIQHFLEQERSTQSETFKLIRIIIKLRSFINR